MMAGKVDGQKVVLGALAICPKSLASITRQRDNLIVKAAGLGIHQATIAKAAGLSQAHVSRLLAAHREATAARKAARASKASDEGRTV